MSAHDVTNAAPAANANGIVVRGAGTFTTAAGPSTYGTATRSSVPTNVASVTLLSANAARRGAIIRNNETAADLFITFGAVAATTANAAYGPVPYGGSVAIDDGYTGEIRGIWSAAGVLGAAITEFSA